MKSWGEGQQDREHEPSGAGKGSRNMKKADVVLNKVYVVKVSGRLTKVRLDSESPYGGWKGTNLVTGREVYIRTAAKLRREYIPKAPVTPGLTETPVVKPGTGPEPLYRRGSIL